VRLVSKLLTRRASATHPGRKIRGRIKPRGTPLQVHSLQNKGEVAKKKNRGEKVHTKKRSHAGPHGHQRRREGENPL